MVILFIINLNSKNRKSFYSNKLYFCYSSGMFVYTIFLLTFKNGKIQYFDTFLIYLDDLNKTSTGDIGEINRLVTLLTVVLNGIVCYVLETLITKLF